jgi:hypothetical protein
MTRRLLAAVAAALVLGTAAVPAFAEDDAPIIIKGHPGR